MVDADHRETAQSSSKVCDIAHPASIVRPTLSIELVMHGDSALLGSKPPA
jgi:hypothetical protein